MNKKWNWLTGGLLLGLIFLLAAWIVKPIGVSTQFVILNGIVWNLFDADLIENDQEAKHKHTSTNVYLNKSGGKYAKSVENPINYGFLFVLSMFLGSIISNVLLKNKVTKDERIRPKVWTEKFGQSISKRYIFAFIGGFLVLFGARLAGGCTSGHMMSGMMQTSLSGYLFALGVFAIAIPFAILVFKNSQKK